MYINVRFIPFSMHVQQTLTEQLCWEQVLTTICVSGLNRYTNMDKGRKNSPSDSQKCGITRVSNESNTIYFLIMKTPALVFYSDISAGNMRGKTHIDSGKQLC